MVDHSFNSEENRLLAQVKAALESERCRRGEDERARFTAAVMKDVKSTGREPGGNEAQRPWFRKKLMLIAAAVFLGVFGVMAMMTDMFRAPRPPDMRPQRLAAERIPVLRDTFSIEDPELFAEVEGQTLVLFTYQHFGERCLWFYPDRLIRWGEDRKADEAFAKIKKWRATVQAGRIEVPAEALGEFNRDGPLILLKIGEHFEVWTEPSLTRYFQKSGKKS